jgi:hypothetical protein
MTVCNMEDHLKTSEFGALTVWEEQLFRPSITSNFLTNFPPSIVFDIMSLLCALFCFFYLCSSNQR